MRQYCMMDLYQPGRPQSLTRRLFPLRSGIRQHSTTKIWQYHGRQSCTYLVCQTICDARLHTYVRIYTPFPVASHTITDHRPNMYTFARRITPELREPSYSANRTHLSQNSYAKPKSNATYKSSALSLPPLSSSTTPSAAVAFLRSPSARILSLLAAGSSH